MNARKESPMMQRIRENSVKVKKTKTGYLGLIAFGMLIVSIAVGSL